MAGEQHAPTSHGFKHHPSTHRAGRMRIRSIKPEFWTSESIARLPWDDRLLFIALWSYVDDNGVGRDNVKLVAADLFPLEDDPRETLARVSRGLSNLSEEGRIVRYTVAGRPFLAVVGFGEHQRIDKPNKPRYPDPSAADPTPTCAYESPRETLATSSRQSRETPSPGAVEQGSSGTGEQEKNSCSPASPSSALVLVSREPSVDELFGQWYAVYPRKKAPQDALKAFRAALKLTTFRDLLVGAERLRDQPGRQPKFTPYPASWLRAGQWADELEDLTRPTTSQHPNDGILQRAAQRALDFDSERGSA